MKFTSIKTTKQNKLQLGVHEAEWFMQRITHESEEPAYHMTYLIPTAKPITAKIYIIDSDDYSTMLLASEY